MTISTRGPEEILVVDRTAVPVQDVCMLLVQRNHFAEVKEKLPVTDEEILESIEAWIDRRPISRHDHIDLKIIEHDDELILDTVSTTEWIFLNIILRGIDDDMTDTTDIGVLYSSGIGEYLKDSFSQVMHGADPNMSDVHEVIMDAFEDVYGKITIDTVDEAITHLKFDWDKVNER